MEEAMEELSGALVPSLGVLSLLPVAVIFIVSVVTKRTLFAMFCGVLAACLLKAGGIPAFFETVTGALYETMSDENWQWIVIVIAVVGMFVCLLERSGAAYNLGRWIEGFVTDKRGVLLGTYLLGLIVFVDDYLSNLTVGATMKRLSDRHRIPRTQLAFITLVMSGPVCLLIPVSSWTVTYAGLMEENGLAAPGSGVAVFISSIPFVFYAWVILAVCLLQILGVIPRIGAIRRDSIRAEERGELFPPGTSAPEDSRDEAVAAGSLPEPWSFIIPLAVTVIVTLVTDFDLIAGGLAGIFLGSVYFIATKKLKFFDVLTACGDGVGRMTFCFILFILAFTVSRLNSELGMPDFVIAAVESLLSSAVLPMLIFVICVGYSFFTGACWDLAMIVMPIVIPLSLAVGVNPVLTAAAVFSGSLYGNVLCPYGDGVILTALACDIKPVDAMYAIAPYMLIAGGVTALLYLAAGFVMA